MTFGALKLFPPDRWISFNLHYENALAVGAPMLASFLTYVAIGLFVPSQNTNSQKFLQALQTEVVAAVDAEAHV